MGRIERNDAPIRSGVERESRESMLSARLDDDNQDEETSLFSVRMKSLIKVSVCQSAWVVEYTDCFSAEE